MKYSANISPKQKMTEPFGYDAFPNWAYGQPMRRQFVCYWFFVGWDCMSLGLHVALTLPNIEVHLPFGFVRIGWVIR